METADDEGIDAQKLLFLACIQSKLESAKFVVERLGANIEATIDEMGNTPLIFVSLEGKADFVRYFLARGANISQTNGLGFSALHSAAVGGHSEVCELLLEAGADVNQRKPDGTTPLMEASLRKHLNVAKCLVEKGGADMEFASSSGHTALTYAAFSGQLDFVRYLLAHGALINGTDIADASPLHYAVFGRHLDVCAALVEAGIDVKQQAGKSGITALHAAYLVNDLNIVKFLVEKAGVDLEIRDASGRTALMGAAFEGQADIVKYLVMKKARIDWKDENGDTAIDYAEKRGHTKIVKILRAETPHNEL
ncbi:hypothetical protein niasHT_023006 [Heterodera trifolii]|uniref:Ankyrin repeat protein n=1 Tax=Heterodera trifolii TaxID=157864 RepID=A0ABD2JXB7_9BILA